MIGFSASFAKTISIILQDLHKSDSLFYYIFNSIIYNMPRTTAIVYISEAELNKALKGLTDCDFETEIVERDDDIVTVEIKW